MTEQKFREDMEGLLPGISETAMAALAVFRAASTGQETGMIQSL